MQDKQEQKTSPIANSVTDACRRLGVGRTTLYELIAARELRTFKIGQRTLIPESELQRFVARSMGVTA
jgi:excisionase family DNA binding protein